MARIRCAGGVLAHGRTRPKLDLGSQRGCHGRNNGSRSLIAGLARGDGVVSDAQRAIGRRRLHVHPITSRPRVTLPDLLCDGLDVVFIGINPSLYSVLQGHYFARKTNRFWPAFSRSALSEPARRALGVERLEPVHDTALQAHGIGFTDVVKRATARADQLDPAEFAAATRDLVVKLETYQPRLACFHGMMGYRPFIRQHAPTLPQPILGEQMLRIGRTRLFVVPNPSPANAHASPAIQAEWYDRIAAALD